MKELATHAIKSIYGKINPKKLEHCFEVIFKENYLFYLVIWIGFPDR